MTRVRNDAAPQWSLSSRGDDATQSTPSSLPRRHVLTAVARRGLPGVIEASLVPSAIFAIVTAFSGTTMAMLAVLAWGCATIARRALTGRSIPAVVLLAGFGLMVKTLVGVVSGSAFAYFLQPIATTVAVGALFFGSVVVGRPVIARIAHDFCPISPEVAARPPVARLFVGLTVLWAAVQLVNAGATLGMLLSLPTTLFVVVKPAMSLLITGAAVVATVWWALRTARREQLVFARA